MVTIVFFIFRVPLLASFHLGSHLQCRVNSLTQQFLPALLLVYIVDWIDLVQHVLWVLMCHESYFWPSLWLLLLHCDVTVYTPLQSYPIISRTPISPRQIPVADFILVLSLSGVTARVMIEILRDTDRTGTVVDS